MHNNNQAEGHHLFGGFISLTTVFLVLGYFCF